ncbi:MAG: hypothetical protein AAF501_06700 [Pseudomonadota bacterium]
MKLIDQILRQPAAATFGRTAGAIAIAPLPGLAQAQFDTPADLAGTSIPPETTVVSTVGHTVPEDRGSALYRRVGAEPAHAGKVRSGDGAWWEIIPDPTGLRPQQFGAVADGTTDDHAALTACFQTALYFNANGNAIQLTGADRVSFSRVRIDLGIGRAYLVSAPIVLDAPRLDICGQNVVVTTTDFDDFVFICTGAVLDLAFHGFTIEATRRGCVQINASNISGARVAFEGMVLVTDPFGHETGIGVSYTNRSSSLTFKGCYFNRIKHPLHALNCDFISFEDCWFGFAPRAVYADRDGYIRIDKGFCRIHNCLFAGGPAGVITGGRQTNGAEIAYLRIGVEGAVAPDEDHGRLSISRTRIGYENGAGALVNYFVGHAAGTGSGFRSGIVLNDIQTFPREEKIANFNGDQVAPLIRLFEMPNQILVDALHANNGNLGIVAPGSTTTLAALRAQVASQAATQIAHGADPADTRTPTADSCFHIGTVTAVHAFLTLTADRTEYNRWLELFRCFDYFFASDAPAPLSAGNTTLASVVTWFTGFTAQRGAIFEVHGGAFGRVSSGNGIELPVHGRVHVMFDEAGDAVHAVYRDLVDSSALPNGVKVEARFDVAGIRSSTVTAAEAPGATLVIEVSHPTNPALSIRCQGLIVRPIAATLPSRAAMPLIQG